MKFIFYSLLFILCINVSINAQMYTIRYKIGLKKDKTEKILVKYGSISKLLKFRWTLYSNQRLALFKSYDEEVSQYIMGLNNNQNAIKFDLTSKSVGLNILPYMILQFQKFNNITRKAVFWLYLFDNANMITVKFLK